jgi:hypothetical protein
MQTGNGQGKVPDSDLNHPPDIHPWNPSHKSITEFT